MSANYWASTQCNNWLLDRPQLDLARKEDLGYATKLECDAIGVKNSFSSVDPFLVCATCIYVSAKTEESPIHIKSALWEATRSFQEVGYRGLPGDNSSLAEMEFCLLEEMEFDLILFHPYRSLIALYDSFGCASASVGKEAGKETGIGGEIEAFGVIKGLRSVEEKQGGGGGGGKLEEFDQQVLQLSWFVLNDCYKTDIPLMYPPYLVALSALYLALMLHGPAADRINSSLENIQTARLNHTKALANPSINPADLAEEARQPTPPKEEALTFFASLNVSLPMLAEVVQEMIAGYKMQNDVATLVGDGPGMVKLLESMRERRRAELVDRKTRRREGGV
ncbi:related to SSN8 - DNA-directed RNA polymerase II holoenzyme and SRB subcomplex subunit, cyclin C homolog [Ustilago sp. UG-2017b]|nr:related to SSN8 - DNA-directed RNA polymerase II holoenzyme and SRB subcomplex subunit, cyclin C homolog [Ustilago sp. UG-2017b]